MPSQRIHFPGADGQRLAARVETPHQTPRTWALLAHCFTCSKDLKALTRVSRALADEGIGVLRFDFTGLGESEGEFAATNFSSNLDDLVAAADFMRRELLAPEILVGHSLGGAAVLAAAHRIPESRAVATLGAPSEPSHLLVHFEPSREAIEQQGEAEVELAGRRFRVRRQLLADLEEHRLAGRIRELGRPLLIFHSPVDQVVGVEHARRIFEAARHPKSFVSLDGADHLLLDDPADALFVGQVLAAWAARYVCGTAEKRAQEPPQGEVWVEGGEQGFTNSVRVRRHHLLADEPRDFGGADAGPSPYEYVLAGLGACTSITLRLYADRKGWPLHGVRVRLEHSRIHAEDCAECETKEGMLDRVNRVIRVDGPLDKEQRQRLFEIANRCPVHRTLTSEVHVVSVLEAGEEEAPSPTT
ncbi:MAG TPA: bifunctional alpha/beta hydrolase/OsmC family protein [Thermoanaerobaculia bacterium]|nr:bifunctional alpha/beta hydrolase/OsmC family protein [Thermoanaerobaculia bacterium]